MRLMQTFRIGLKNIVIAVVAAVSMSAVLGLFRDDWTAYFLSSAPSIATGLLAVASLWSAREGFEAGVRSVGQAPPGQSPR
jgi:hypothetical protein